MTNSQFLKQLERELSGLPSAERKDILYDYEEHLRSAMEQGVSEEDAVQSLGSPRLIAKELLASHLISQAEQSKSVGNVMRAVLATIGLGFFNIVVVLGPFLGISGCLIGLFGVSLGFIVGPMIGIIGMLTGHANYASATPVQASLFLVGMDGIGWLLLALCIVLVKFGLRLTVKYLRFNLRIIQGGHV